MTIGQAGIQFLEDRGIDVEVATRLGLHTVIRRGAGDAAEHLTSEQGQIMAYPFFDGGELVNVKYRGLRDKLFWNSVGGKPTFWNVDALDDPSLHSGHAALHIFEGIEDALVAIQCGFPLSVSVPNGAPDPKHQFDIAEDATNRFAFVHANRERLRLIKRFVLATDADPNGRHLADELLRRLGAARCSFIELPEGVKDINELLLRDGPAAVLRVFNSAKPYPVRGLYKVRDYPPRPALETFRTGWPTLDQHLLLFPGEFVVITGIPSHGKSAWVLNLLVNLAELHGWRSVLFSPEMPAVPVISGTIRKIRLRGHVPADTSEVDQWIDSHFSFIDADPTGMADEDEPFDLDWILEKARDAVIRDGTNALVIDPWNEIEHARRRNEMVTDYVARSIRALKRFAALYKVTVIVVAHPTKDVWTNGKTREVHLYDIEGSAHWFNKCDHGIVIDRLNDGSTDATVRVVKARFAETGRRGSVKLKFDQDSASFHMLAPL
jgi:twinkle protein